MNEFIARLLNVLLIIVSIVGYNSMVSQRIESEQAIYTETMKRVELVEKSNKINYETTANSNKAGEKKFKDGNYSGTAQGFGGNINVSVKVENGAITSVSIDSAKGEDEAYLTMANEIVNSIIETQSTDVDTISGATFSSTGIKNAVIAALEGATYE